MNNQIPWGASALAVLFAFSPTAAASYPPDIVLDTGLMFPIWITIVSSAAFVVLTFWKWRLNVVAVVLAGGVLGFLRAFLPGLFGGPLS